MRRWRPSEPHTRLLHTAFDAAPEAVARAWAEWQADNDIQTTDHDALKLMATVGKRLGDHAIDDPSLNRLRGLRRHGFVEHTRRTMQLLPIVQAFAADQITPIVVGGLALSPLVYGEVGLRATADTALLIHHDEVPRAVRRLRALGFTPCEQHPPTLTSALMGRTNLAAQGYTHALRWGRSDGASSGTVFAFDLQWALLPSQVGPHSDDHVHARAVPFATGDLVAKALSPTDQLIAAVMRGVVEDVPTPPEWVADALAVLTRDGGNHRVDWDALVAEAIRRAIELPLREGLDYLSAEFADVLPVLDGRSQPLVPEAVLTGLMKTPETSTIDALQRLRYLDRLRDPAPSSSTGTGLVALMPHLDGRAPIDAALVSARFALHRLAATPTITTLSPGLRTLVRPFWRALKRFV